MRRLISHWKTQPPEYREYLLIYVIGLLWAVAYYIFPTIDTTKLVSGLLVAVWCGTTVIGAALSLTGLIRGDNLLLERLGVSITLLAPIIYIFVQIGGALDALWGVEGLEAAGTYVPRILLGLWLLVFLNKRRRHLARKVRIAKQTPLDRETQEL